MKKMRMRNIRYIIEKYISDHQSHQDTPQMEKCITCKTMTFLANYTDLLSTVYTVRLCSQCNRILSNA